jgi:hypothetical protein
MSLIVDQPVLGTSDALRDEPPRLVEPPVIVDDLEIIDDECPLPHDPPSDLLLTAASLALWVGVAVVVRRVVARRHQRA